MVEAAIQFIGIVFFFGILNVVAEKVEFLEKFKEPIKWASIVILTTLLISTLVELLSGLIEITGFDAQEIMQFVGIAFIFGVIHFVFEKVNFLGDYKNYVMYAGFMALTWQIILMLERLLSDIITIFNL